MLDYEGRYLPEGESYKGGKNMGNKKDKASIMPSLLQAFLIGCSFAVVLLAWAGQIAAMW